jgi:pyrimidine deaminase RibD-like protein
VTDGDHSFMRQAIALAAKQVGRTGDNPAVGCVLVVEGQVVGAEATGVNGRPHAEETALATAAESARGATAYVTLEPCAERSAGGKSCARRLAEAGVKRVVIACADASRFAAGRGQEVLEAAGVLVEVGLLEDEATRLYADYRPRGLERPD